MDTGEQVTVTIPQPGTMSADGAALVAQAQAVKITDDASYQSAANLLTAVAALKKRVTEEIAPSKKSAHETHKRISDLEKRMLEAPTRAEQIIKTAMGDWVQTETRRRAQEAAVAQEAVRKAQEDERLALAEQLDRGGMKAEAEAILDAPIATPAVVATKVQAAGVSAATRYTFEVVDPAKVKREYCVPDEKAIGALVRSLGPRAAAMVGGIVVRPVVDIRARAK